MYNCNCYVIGSINAKSDDFVCVWQDGWLVHSECESWKLWQAYISSMVEFFNLALAETCDTALKKDKETSTW